MAIEWCKPAGRKLASACGRFLIRRGGRGGSRKFTLYVGGFYAATGTLKALKARATLWEGRP